MFVVPSSWFWLRMPRRPILSEQYSKVWESSIPDHKSDLCSFQCGNCSEISDSKSTSTNSNKHQQNPRTQFLSVPPGGVSFSSARGGFPSGWSRKIPRSSSANSCTSEKNAMSECSDLPTKSGGNYVYMYIRICVWMIPQTKDVRVRHYYSVWWFQTFF